MSEPADLQSVVKAIVDANQYLTLATADEDGQPWASPVWFASTDYREFFWVSSPAPVIRATSRFARSSRS
jgi:predicted pyridoxine 5'-phosphate oxidase superfamily flavin-nucleotide-binding protein